MALIFLVTADQAVLTRWTGLVRQCGHESAIRSPTELLAAPERGANMCVYDLGARGDADTQPLTGAIKAMPQSRFIALTSRPDPQEGLALLRAGLRGYCNRLASAKVIAALLSTVEAGEIWAGRQVTDHLLQMAMAKAVSSDAAKTGLFGRLTARESEIAQQVAAGRSNKVIAADSNITERTVKAHLNSIFRKTGIRNRVQLALAVSQLEDDQRRLSNG